jgi:hypothetical protein
MKIAKDVEFQVMTTVKGGEPDQADGMGRKEFEGN